MSDSTPVRFGANYTPRVGWFHHWLDFNLAEVQRDFDALAELGVDHLRLFAVWHYFQPHRGLIRAQALDQLALMVQVAGERGLDCSVDGLNGHLSSFDFVPSWLRTWHRRNVFTDAVAVAAEQDYLLAITRQLKGLPNYLGMSLGNEFSQFTSPEHPERELVSAAQANSWAAQLLAALEAEDPRGQYCHSEYDAALFNSKHPFTPAQTGQLGAMATVHSWVFNGTAQRYGGASEPSLRLAEYLIELTRAYVNRAVASVPQRKIWLQEIGAPPPYVTAEAAPDFAEQSIQHALGCENLWGVTWWCSHDVSRKLLDFPELEYSLGLLDEHNRPKPLGTRFAELAAAKPSANTVPRRRAVELDLNLGREQCAPGGAVFTEWMARAQAGERPGIAIS